MIAVEHNEFIEMGIGKIRKYGIKDSIIYDVKGIFGINDADARL